MALLFCKQSLALIHADVDDGKVLFVPWVETDFDPTDVAVSCTVDGDRRQDGRTKDLIFPIPYLIEYITRFTTLRPGDVILTGTPEGVRPIEPGNTITVAVEGLGSLSNRVVAE